MTPEKKIVFDILIEELRDAEGYGLEEGTVDLLKFLLTEDPQSSPPDSSLSRRVSDLEDRMGRSDLVVFGSPTGD